jgi:hypothetical protein
MPAKPGIRTPVGVVVFKAMSGLNYRILHLNPLEKCEDLFAGCLCGQAHRLTPLILYRLSLSTGYVYTVQARQGKALRCLRA